MLREMRPLVEPQLDPALDEVIAGASKLVQVAAIYREHGDEIREIEMAQFRALLNADFDADYLELCRTHGREGNGHSGFEGRARLNCGAAVLRHAIDALARNHRLSSSPLATRSKVLSQAIFFDIATTSTYLSAADQGDRSRPGARRIDDAIGDFDGAIGGVIDAIKEASDIADRHVLHHAAASPTTRCGAWRRHPPRRSKPPKASMPPLRPPKS